MNMKLIFKRFFFTTFFLVLSVAFSLSHADNLYPDPYGKKLDADYNSTLFLSSEDQEAHPHRAYLYALALLYGDDGKGVDKNTEKSIEILQHLWEQGYSDAGYTLASIYYSGVEKNKDYSKAKMYLIDAAKSGYVLAQKDLARAYSDSEEGFSRLFKKSPGKEVYWYEKAAKSGDRQSALNMSRFYEKGKNGVEKNSKKSFQWLKLAADAKYRGISICEKKLAEFYAEGIGAEPDLVKAYFYYDLCGTAGVKNKERVAEEMTQDQIDEATRQSRAWQEEHNIYVPSYSGLEHQSDGSYQ